MNPISTLTVSCVLLSSTLATLTSAKRFSKEKDAVLLENIKALTFQDGKDTTHRRVSALPQLTCTSGSGCPYYTPPSIRCLNSGSSYTTSDVEWTCTASLPPEFKLGSTDVICEGYDSPDDPYVLKGSCALEYRLLLTDAGAEKFGGRGWAGKASTRDGKRGGNSGERGESDGSLGALLFGIVFVAVLAWILYAFLSSILSNRLGGPPRRGSPRGGGGGGYDNDDDNDPPPPYPGRSPRTKSKAADPLLGNLFGTSGNARQTRAQRQPRGNQQQGEGWRPGFWTGTAAGAAAGWLAGGRGAGRTTTQQRDNGEGSSRDARGWGFGGGRGGSGGGGSSGPSVSSERYDSTGFGGTRRR